MDPALVDFDFAKAGAILADMVASYLGPVTAKLCKMAIWAF
jgi:hypothetical protein